MSIDYRRQSIAGETLFPPRAAPFSLRTWGTSRFPTPLPAQEREGGS